MRIWLFELLGVIFTLNPVSIKLVLVVFVDVVVVAKATCRTNFVAMEPIFVSVIESTEIVEKSVLFVKYLNPLMVYVDVLWTVPDGSFLISSKLRSIAAVSFSS